MIFIKEHFWVQMHDLPLASMNWDIDTHIGKKLREGLGNVMFTKIAQVREMYYVSLLNWIYRSQLLVEEF